MSMRIVAAFILAVLLGTPGVAQDAPAVPATPEPPAGGEPPTIHRYGDVDNTCQRWTDGCRTCSRGEAAAPLCSNIGIACQPAAITCTARIETPPK
jgi:hypothetical protein